MKIRVFLFWALMVLTFFSCVNKEKKIREELNLGIKANYANKTEMAIEHFQNVIRMDSNNAEGYFNIGLSYMSKADYRLALKQFSHAIQLNPKYGEAYRSRAQLHFILGDRDASCQDYLKAEELGIENLHNYTKFCK